MVAMSLVLSSMEEAGFLMTRDLIFWISFETVLAFYVSLLLLVFRKSLRSYCWYLFCISKLISF
jgi:hypothetical protein